MSPTLVFEIETIPDIAGMRRVFRLADTLSDDDVLAWYLTTRRQATGSDFAHHYFQQVVAIAVAFVKDDHLNIWSVGETTDQEGAIIQRFFDGIEKYKPQLVSWNGGGFDLPVLHYRSMLHGVSAPRYWELGESDTGYRYNNYIARYHTRHLDLMDILSMYQARAVASLDAMARLCGFPGKLLMDGGNVREAMAQNRLNDVRNYCETDVLNTYLLFLRFQKMRGVLDKEGYDHAIDVTRAFLQKSQADHWQAFDREWVQATPATA
ncbi:MAG: 3'-5' exonuclease [Burkholderiales bacterium]|jgi:predicted PolB exonuclease-like 3'-5' exonuclease|nr:3'-5' exonuclease [Burkholderiales bacterium]